MLAITNEGVCINMLKFAWWLSGFPIGTKLVICALSVAALLIIAIFIASLRISGQRRSFDLSSLVIAALLIGGLFWSLYKSICKVEPGHVIVRDGRIVHRVLQKKECFYSLRRRFGEDAQVAEVQAVLRLFPPKSMIIDRKTGAVVMEFPDGGKLWMDDKRLEGTYLAVYGVTKSTCVDRNLQYLCSNGVVKVFSYNIKLTSGPERKVCLALCNEYGAGDYMKAIENEVGQALNSYEALALRPAKYLNSSDPAQQKAFNAEVAAWLKPKMAKWHGIVTLAGAKFN